MSLANPHGWPARSMPCLQLARCKACLRAHWLSVPLETCTRGLCEPSLIGYTEPDHLSPVPTCRRRSLPARSRSRSRRRPRPRAPSRLPVPRPPRRPRASAPPCAARPSTTPPSTLPSTRPPMPPWSRPAAPPRPPATTTLPRRPRLPSSCVFVVSWVSTPR